MKVNGRVGWLYSDTLHNDSPTLKKYFTRLNRYTSLQAEEIAKDGNKSTLTVIRFTIFKPILVFINLYIRHKGLMSGARGFLWSLFSASHYPIAYLKYYTQK